MMVEVTMDSYILFLNRLMDQEQKEEDKNINDNDKHWKYSRNGMD